MATEVEYDDISPDYFDFDVESAPTEVKLVRNGIYDMSIKGASYSYTPAREVDDVLKKPFAKISLQLRFTDPEVHEVLGTDATLLFHTFFLGVSDNGVVNKQDPATIRFNNFLAKMGLNSKEAAELFRQNLDSATTAGEKQQIYFTNVCGALLDMPVKASVVVNKKVKPHSNAIEEFVFN